jgi:hypothetical protein
MMSASWRWWWLCVCSRWLIICWKGWNACKIEGGDLDVTDVDISLLATETPSDTQTPSDTLINGLLYIFISTDWADRLQQWGVCKLRKPRRQRKKNKYSVLLPKSWMRVNMFRCVSVQ